MIAQAYREGNGAPEDGYAERSAFGSVTARTVPLPGDDRYAKRPPRNAARSRAPFKPRLPSARSRSGVRLRASNPQPLSCTYSR